MNEGGRFTMIAMGSFMIQPGGDATARLYLVGSFI